MNKKKHKQELIDAITKQIQDLSVNDLQAVLVKIWMLKKDGV